MPSLPSKILSACALVTPLLAAALPTVQPSDLTQLNGRLLQFRREPLYAHALFSVPCPECLGSSADTGHGDESIILSFKSHAQDEACGSSNVTLNGAYLPQTWDGDFASGAGNYTAATDFDQDESFSSRDLDLEWTSACLHGADDSQDPAQLLTVSIKAIDGKELGIPSGFTVSFQQQTSPPSLLRIEPAPHIRPSDAQLAQSWREPPNQLTVTYINNTRSTETSIELLDQSLEAELVELRALQAELLELQQAIVDKKKHIHSKFRKEAQLLAHKLSDCDSLSCIVKTLAHKAHGAWKLASLRLQSNHDESATMGRPEHLDAYVPAHGHAPQLSGGHLKAAEFSKSYESPAAELPPRPPKVRRHMIVIEVTVSLLCCGCIVAFIRRKWQSLRTKVDRAAAREERNNARAYRRAARWHAWRKWWCGNWQKDVERMADYEEKRALIVSQETILEGAMQEEIRQLRAAHDVVNDLVRDAEEGRSANQAPCHCRRPRGASIPYSPSVASTYPPTSVADIPSRPLSRTDSLPSYRTGPASEPPSYDSDNDMSGIVANGFRHYASSTPSERSEPVSHWTPDSSVVDVSPRPSADTLRYTRSIMTCEEESDED